MNEELIILITVQFIFRVVKSKKERKIWGQGDSNTQPFDLESNALPLRHALLFITEIFNK